MPSATVSIWLRPLNDIHTPGGAENVNEIGEAKLSSEATDRLTLPKVPWRIDVPVVENITEKLASWSFVAATPFSDVEVSAIARTTVRRKGTR